MGKMSAAEDRRRRKDERPKASNGYLKDPRDLTPKQRRRVAKKARAKAGKKLWQPGKGPSGLTDDA